MEANGGKPAELQVKDQFLLRREVGGLMKVKSLAALTQVKMMRFKDFEIVPKNYLQPHERLVFAEQTKFVACTQTNGESLCAFLAKPQEAASFFDFGKPETVACPSAYMTRLRFIAVLQNKMLEHKVKNFGTSFRET